MFAVIGMSDLEKRHAFKFTLRITEHPLKGGIGSKHSSIRIGKCNPDSGVFKDRSPPQGVGSLSLRDDFRRRREIVGCRGWSRLAHGPRVRGYKGVGR